MTYKSIPYLWQDLTDYIYPNKTMNNHSCCIAEDSTATSDVRFFFVGTRAARAAAAAEQPSLSSSSRESVERHSYIMEGILLMKRVDGIQCMQVGTENI